MYNCPNMSRRDHSYNWKGCFVIFACEVGERVAYYAVSSTLTVYLTTVLQETVAEAARNYNNWAGTTFLTSFIGAFIADAFLDRCWTIVWSMITTFLRLLFKVRKYRCVAED
ncbi:hypothetical protein MPTK1_4g15670 [Marchantia polymorpha subsp. ruderalis]|uniref:Uncharacterized protein n=2 Tax=Marchantia polymorpha TaxID=3197 RepID=A0AAF6BA98_MARPO|nr:hypothetical protein MARPO_0054s0032 [Marchantia polymorpha]BBN08932.1 hypothetical protein Mp_4g15670 [Marchantia polymorpha subsp. ruderalis]|eukprot:PTQ37918.1 hypothetical protein MARPO_0054s0032 [Marchantia polymorpha]